MDGHVPSCGRSSFPDILGLRVVPAGGRSSFPDVLGLRVGIVPGDGRSLFPDILGLRVVPGDGRLDHKPCSVPLFAVSIRDTLNGKQRRYKLNAPPPSSRAFTSATLGDRGRKTILGIG